MWRILHGSQFNSIPTYLRLHVTSSSIFDFCLLLRKKTNPPIIYFKPVFFSPLTFNFNINSASSVLPFSYSALLNIKFCIENVKSRFEVTQSSSGWCVGVAVALLLLPHRQTERSWFAFMTWRKRDGAATWKETKVNLKVIKTLRSRQANNLCK